MGLFSKNPICSVCHEECDYPKYQLGDGNWLCQDCLKDAKLNKADLKNLSVSDIKGKINDQKDQDNLAVSMYRYAVENKFGSGWNETWGIKHFSVIAEHLAISIHPPRAGWDVKVYKIIPFYCTALYGNDKRNGKRHSEIAENGCVFPKHRYARQKHSANRHGNLCSLPLRTFK